jgi:hypothetical protein
MIPPRLRGSINNSFYSTKKGKPTRNAKRHRGQRNKKFPEKNIGAKKENGPHKQGEAI